MRFLLFFLGILLFDPLSVSASPAPGGSPIHWSGDDTKWNRKDNIVELFGNAKVSQTGETLTADYIKLNLANRTVEAKGNCVYYSTETTVHCEELHFNLDTRAGSIIGGKVSNGAFLLSGKRINKLGDGKFQTHEAEYTTCRDCPGSWSFVGKDVDMAFGGYAYMSNVTAKIKDTPVFWLPYLVIPIKTERQTGLLFPRLGYSQRDGFRLFQPFFWAISRSTDMTIGGGNFSERGLRAEVEGRYVLSPKSDGVINYYYNQDKREFSPKRDRWAVKFEQKQQLPYRIEQKFRFREVSDNEYPIDFFEDIEGRYDPVIASDLIFSRTTSNLSTIITARRFRNLLNFDNPTHFDDKTVQIFPKIEATSNDRVLMSDPNLTAGLTLGVTHFTRTTTPFDFGQSEDRTDCTDGVFCPGVDPVREGTRVSATPRLYTTIRPWDTLSVIPSVRYHAFFYSFQNTIPSLNRGYLQAQAEMSLQLERVYERDDPEIPKVKHLIRPKLTYSNIPFEREPDHPFISQINLRDGYNFDNQDIVPKGRPPSVVNYFVPLGNSLSYGVTNQIIRKRYKTEGSIPVYQRIVELSAGQTLDIRELKKNESERIPLSRLFSNLTLNFDQFSASTEYFFYPKLGRLLTDAGGKVSPHQVKTGFTYVWEKGIHQDVLEFERSVSMNYTFKRLSDHTSQMGLSLNYSISDYILPKLSVQYDFVKHDVTSADVKIIFQSPSRCWRIELGESYSVDTKTNFSFNLSLNLTGESFLETSTESS